MGEIKSSSSSSIGGRGNGKTKKGGTAKSKSKAVDEGSTASHYEPVVSIVLSPNARAHNRQISHHAVSDGSDQEEHMSQQHYHRGKMTTSSSSLRNRAVQTPSPKKRAVARAARPKAGVTEDQIQAFLENYDLEMESRLTRLRNALELRIKAARTCMEINLQKNPPAALDMPLGEFVDDYGAEVRAVMGRVPAERAEGARKEWEEIKGENGRKRWNTAKRGEEGSEGQDRRQGDGHNDDGERPSKTARYLPPPDPPAAKKRAGSSSKRGKTQSNPVRPSSGVLDASATSTVPSTSTFAPRLAPGMPAPLPTARVASAPAAAARQSTKKVKRPTEAALALRAGERFVLADAKGTMRTYVVGSDGVPRAISDEEAANSAEEEESSEEGNVYDDAPEPINGTARVPPSNRQTAASSATRKTSSNSIPFPGGGPVPGGDSDEGDDDDQFGLPDVDALTAEVFGEQEALRQKQGTVPHPRSSRAGTHAGNSSRNVSRSSGLGYGADSSAAHVSISSSSSRHPATSSRAPQHTSSPASPRVAAPPTPSRVLQGTASSRARASPTKPRTKTVAAVGKTMGKSKAKSDPVTQVPIRGSSMAVVPQAASSEETRPRTRTSILVPRSTSAQLQQRYQHEQVPHRDAHSEMVEIDLASTRPEDLQRLGLSPKSQKVAKEKVRAYWTGIAGLWA